MTSREEAVAIVRKAEDYTGPVRVLESPEWWAVVVVDDDQVDKGSRVVNRVTGKLRYLSTTSAEDLAVMDGFLGPSSA
jgi:hypothetical protein